MSVRLISTATADMVIKALRFLCSKSYTDKAHKVCFGGKTRHGLVFFFFFPSLSLPLLPVSFHTEIRKKLPECHGWKQPQAYGAANVALICSQASQRCLVRKQEWCPGEAAGCLPETAQGGIYLGEFPSLWPPALEIQKPAFAGTPRRDPSVRRTLPLTQITRLKYKAP